MLIVLSYTADQADRAEKLCDFIYALSGRVKAGSCLLIASADVHEEYRIKVRLAAEVAFEHVDMTIAAGSLFSAAASKVKDTCKDPWLFLEPDCVPLRPDWIDQLENFYLMQPKKFTGAHVKNDAGEIFLARNSIYPADFHPDADRIAASTKCRLIQHGTYTKRDEIRPDAVLYCADKGGSLMKELRSELKGK